MLTPVPPINNKAAQAANRSLAAKNPDLAGPDGTLKPVDGNTPRGQALRQQWVQSYVANGGKARVQPSPQRPAQVKKAQAAARQLPAKPPSAAMVQCAVLARGGHGSTGAGAAPPVSGARHPCQPGDKTCKAMNPRLHCSHGQPGRQPTGGLLEVVPAEAGDTISLACAASGCGKPPVWSISGHTHGEKSGTSTSFNAERWLIRAVMGMHWAATVTPKTYRVHVGTDCGTRSAEYTIRAFPSDKFSITINGKEWVEMRSRVKYAQEVIIGAFLPNVSFSEFLVGKLDVTAGWEEDGASHLAYYGWKVTGSFDPLFGFKGRIPFGPLAAIPQWLKKYGDAYFFVEFSGGIGFAGDWGRTGPNKLSGSLKATGKIGGKIGGSMFLVGNSVIVMEVAGSSGITVEAEPDLSSKETPACKVGCKWDGLKAEVTIIAARGIIEVKREFKACDERELFDQTFQVPVGHG